jgi:threonine dehydrogenase-like Zn-dependent dehydrogenase
MQLSLPVLDSLEGGPSAYWLGQHRRLRLRLLGDRLAVAMPGVGCGKQRDIPSVHTLDSSYLQRCEAAKEGQAACCRHRGDQRAGCVECYRYQRGEHTG